MIAWTGLCLRCVVVMIVPIRTPPTIPGRADLARPCLSTANIENT